VRLLKVSLGISNSLIKAAIAIALIIVLIIIMWGVGIFFGVLPDTL